jgi:hypothetical protein
MLTLLTLIILLGFLLDFWRGAGPFAARAARACSNSLKSGVGATYR